MPTYDYVCDACGHQFEAFQTITEAAMQKCPECGKLKLRRLFGPGRGHRLQRLRILPDGLSQRVLSKGRRG